MDLEELRGFLTVVDKGSFVSAALELGISRATLRRRVDSLEAQTGTDLLNRTAQGVNLTSAGRILADRGRKFMIEAAALLSAPRQARQEPSKPLRIVAPPGMPLDMLKMAIDLGGTLNAKFSVEIVVTGEPLLTDPKTVDLVLFHGAPPSPEDWRIQELMSVPLSVMASPGYLDKHGTPASPEDLKDHQLVTWTQSGFSRTWPLRDGGELDIEPRAVSNDAMSLIRLIRVDRAIGLLPDANLSRLGVSDELEGLVRVLPGEVGGTVSVAVGIPRKGQHDSSLISFVSALAELLSRVRWR